MERERVTWIDVAKGIGIALIVYGHVFGTGSIRAYIYSFHVPLFFFLSGLCTVHKEHAKEELISLSKRIVIPYFTFSIISICLVKIVSLLYQPINDVLQTSFLRNILVMLYGNSKPDIMKYNSPLWFLTCYCIVYLIAWGIHLICNEDNKQRILACFVIASVIFNILVPNKEDLILPWHFETAFSMISWFLLGEIVRSKLFKNIKTGFNIKIVTSLLLAVGAGIIASVINTKTVGIRNDSYGNYFCYYLGTIAGIIAVILISCLIRSKIIEMLGKHTLFVLGFHRFILQFFDVIVNSFDLHINPDSLVGILYAVIITIVSILISIGIEYSYKIIKAVLRK